MSEPGISPRDEIAILLAEYGTLRDELLQRNTILNQTFFIAATLGAALIGLLLTSLWVLAVVLIIFSPIPILITTLLIRFDTYKAAARIRDIESAVNKIANKRLLIWETDNGRYKIGPLNRIRWLISGAEESELKVDGDQSN